ncbi:TonB-dependent receptor domain-containing protein [Sphingomonas sp. URHD0057]|uniref:TonB-dependent receptor domain-containing protein n=1 Tax=Sphingomonas sp. URHD0057 TaxID=1380389 RepID=UPI000686ED76|nr:TonB-dependent receptor [Sphingomonas sp. URHD0057]
MVRMSPASAAALAVSLAFAPGAALAQSRADENAVTQAEDAFGYSVGRESLGIYDADDARGFSPTAAGNLRIDGLYFAPVVGLPGLLIESQSIKVGLSAQGYPFAAPSGIVDISLRRPADSPGASVIVNGDSYGTLGAELDASLPVASTLSIGVGLNIARYHFADGTRNHEHTQAMVGRWRPARGVEIVPFWSAFTDYDNNSSPVYIPAGEFLPPQPRAGHFTGPWWDGINRTHFNSGLLTSVALSDNWLLRAGVFRSIRHLRNGFTYLFADLQPDGLTHRIMFADQPSNNRGISGEARLTRTVSEGPRLHTLHVSLRGREVRREYGGEDEIDVGVGSMFEDIDSPRPQFAFGEQSRDHVRQWIYGVAYDGRWKSVGELSFSISKTAYRKDTDTPDVDLTSRASPLLYNGTVTLLPLRGVAVYGGYARGFEENGSPPANAVNRSDALPAILTRQIDGGVRVDLAPHLRAVAGVFDLSRPYFGFDQSSHYVQIGTTRSRGAEFSLSGNVSDQLALVAGGVLLSPRVEADPSASGAIGARPVGIPSHIFSLDANWDAATLVRGLSLDAALSHRGRTPATTDNAVELPGRAQLDLGTRYRFAVGKVRATARFQVVNLFNERGFVVGGPGAYFPVAARSASAYLTVDL